MKHARPDYDRLQDPAGLIPDLEPVFLLRGQDRNSIVAILAWAASAEMTGASPEIVMHARVQAEAMRKWQEAGHVKTPDLPLAK